MEKKEVKDKAEFIGARKNSHFKMDKQTKRLMASLGKFPNTVKLSDKEQKEAEIKLENLTPNSLKNLMIDAQLSSMSASASGMRDPLWKPKKDKPSEEEGDAVSANGKLRKGKRSIKMRKESESAPVVTE